MLILGSLKKAYVEGGVRTIIARVYLKILMRKSVKIMIKRTAGEVFYERLKLFKHLGYWPKIKNPRSFNEKINHRKFFTNNEMYSLAEDKYEVRSYVQEKVGDEILPDIYCVAKEPETIPFEDFPDKFVVKANHGSGWNIIVENKEEANFECIKNKCKKWLKKKYDEEGHQYWYWDINPRIIVEKYIETPKSSLIDYKFFVFNGEVEYIQADLERHKNHKRRIYDKEWNPQEFELDYPLGPVTAEPSNLEEMIEIAEKLAEEFEFIRVDLYNPEDGKVVFGELTVGHGNGKERFRPKKYDFEVGSKWDIN